MPPRFSRVKYLELQIALPQHVGHVLQILQYFHPFPWVKVSPGPVLGIHPHFVPEILFPLKDLHSVPESIIVNTIVIVWGLAPSEKKIGTYTGMYYLFTFSAEIFGPGLVGLITDLIGWEYFFLNVAIFTIIALILMFFVKREEAELTEEEKEAKKKALQEL